jgi:hypothetical protein
MKGKKSLTEITCVVFGIEGTGSSGATMRVPSLVYVREHHNSDTLESILKSGVRLEYYQICL